MKSQLHTLSGHQVEKPYWKQIGLKMALDIWRKLTRSVLISYALNMPTGVEIPTEPGWVRVPTNMPSEISISTTSLADWRVTNGPCGQWLPSSATCCSDRQLWLCTPVAGNQLKLASWSCSAELQFWLKTGWVGSDQWSMWSVVALFSEHAQRNYDSDASLASGKWSLVHVTSDCPVQLCCCEVETDLAVR